MMMLAANFPTPEPTHPKLLPLKWMKTLMAGMKGRKATQANPSASLRCRPHIIYNFPTPSATTLTLIARLIYWMKTVTSYDSIYCYFSILILLRTEGLKWEHTVEGKFSFASQKIFIENTHATFSFESFFIEFFLIACLDEASNHHWQNINTNVNTNTYTNTNTN